MEWICKLAGMTCMLASAGVFCMEYGKSLTRRNRQLRKLYGILLQLKSEMAYMNYTLPECFEKMGKTAEPPFQEWLQSLWRQLNLENTEQGGAVFEAVWSSQLKELEQTSDLQAEDIELLKELGDKLGAADIEGQKKAVDYVLLQLERNRSCLEEEMEQRKKVVTACTMFGSVLMIILLF
jgi:stage III sporulation protein AB